MVKECSKFLTPESLGESWQTNAVPCGIVTLTFNYYYYFILFYFFFGGGVSRTVPQLWNAFIVLQCFASLLPAEKQIKNHLKEFKPSLPKA